MQGKSAAILGYHDAFVENALKYGIKFCETVLHAGKS
jgi:hypothetical protein